MDRMMKKRWQNLIHLKCIYEDCNERLIENRAGYNCPNPDRHFFMTHNNLVKTLTDSNHVLRQFATNRELEALDEGLKKMGINPKDFWQTSGKNDKLNT